MTPTTAIQRAEQWRKENACGEAAKVAIALLNELERSGRIIDGLLAHCGDGECLKCGEIVCEFGEPLHFHHDGCPACDGHHGNIE